MPRQLGTNRRRQLLRELFNSTSYIVGPPSETTKCAICGEVITDDYIDIGNPPEFCVDLRCVKEIIEEGIDVVVGKYGDTGN